jgi:hypothetical protein
MVAADAVTAPENGASSLAKVPGKPRKRRPRFVL